MPGGCWIFTLGPPTRETCVIERQTTNTPLQALALWNDEGMVAATSALARLVAGTEGDRVGLLFRRLLQRDPDATERQVCRALFAATLEKAKPELASGLAETAVLLAWQQVASTLLSLDEALHRN
jgi:hypothetical protein